MRLTQLLLGVAICFTQADVNNRVCWALCRRDGYDLGVYEKKYNACLCGNKQSFEFFTSKSVLIRGQSSEQISFKDDE